MKLNISLSATAPADLFPLLCRTAPSWFKKVNGAWGGVVGTFVPLSTHVTADVVQRSGAKIYSFRLPKDKNYAARQQYLTKVVQRVADKIGLEVLGPEQVATGTTGLAVDFDLRNAMVVYMPPQ